MILTCEQAQIILVQENKREPRPQALLDFLNDCGARISADRVWCRNAVDPSPDITFTVLKPVSLHYVEHDAHGKLCLRRQTCSSGEVFKLLDADAGVGTLTIRAQLYAISKRDATQVRAS